MSKHRVKSHFPSTPAQVLGGARAFTVVKPRSMQLKYQLPALYQKVLPQMLLELDPVETKANCDACSMAPGRHRGKTTYRDDLKCCTFHPWLPNFAVGALLREGPAVALREKIKRREYSLPIGLTPSVRYQLEFNERGLQDFGNREDWLCPYYDQGRCTVWRHRGSVCVSFYCKSSQGSSGKRFWKSLEGLLAYVEMAMMEEALVHLDFSPRQVCDLLGYMNRTDGTAQEKKSDSIPEKKARALWNGYFDEQELFFEKCIKVVENLSVREVHESLGDTGEFLLASTLADARCFG